VHAELAAKGIRVGCKRVARLMTQTGLAGVCRRRFVVRCGWLCLNSVSLPIGGSSAGC
jgi:hypothetical protein